MGTIDEILNDEGPAPEAITQPEPEAPVEPVASEPEAATRTGREGPVCTQGRTSGAPAPDRLPQDEFKALKDERTKRQTLESELATLKQQFQQLQNPPEPPPSVFEDEQGWQQHFGSVVKSGGPAGNAKRQAGHVGDDDRQATR
jgi:hypothetical protein